MRLSLVIFVLAFLSLSLNAQPIRFYAKSDASKIIEGSYFNVDFVLENDDGDNFKPPKFEGFDIVGGPNRSNSMSIVNGKVSKSLSLGYSIKPKTIGIHKIGSASIRTKSGMLKTKELTLEVVKGTQPSSKNGESIFVQTMISDSLGYVGQQIILEYKLFTTEEVRSVNFTKDEEFEGFFTQPINTTGESTKREIFNGVEYATKVIKRIALFPQQTGRYVIHPASINLGIADKNSRSRGFFFSSQLTPKRIVAEGKTLIINNTPALHSESFSGAIGKYSMSATASKRNLTTDEAIVLHMFIQGDGDSKTVSAPKWSLSDSLEIYDPNIIEDENFPNSPKILHKKTFEYLIVPKYPGKYSITPEFTYFDTKKNDYVKLTRILPPFNVIKGSQSNLTTQVQNEIDAKPIYKTAKFGKTQNVIHGTLLHWMFLIIVTICMASIFLFNRYLEKSGQKDPALIRKNKALSLALKRLEGAKTFKEDDNISKFYEELAVAVKKFITDKYAIQAMHINNTDIIKELESRKLSETLISSFSSILTASATALYAPSLASDMDTVYKQTVKLFASIEG